MSEPQLGMYNMPSRNWWVQYNGSFSLGAVVGVGVHEFVFRGDDSLSGAVVRLDGASLGASLGLRWLGKGRSGGQGRQSSGGAGDALERGEKGVNTSDAARDSQELADNPAPWCDMKNASLLRAKRPFSLYEMNQAWGGIEGIVSGDVVVAGAALLRIHASMSVISNYEASDANTLFEGWQIYGTNEGAIGVNIGILQGKWSIPDGRYGDIYTQRCPIKAGPGLENFLSSNPRLQNIPKR